LLLQPMKKKEKKRLHIDVVNFMIAAVLTTVSLTGLNN
jgi:hypothetical protein